MRTRTQSGVPALGSLAPLLRMHLALALALALGAVEGPGPGSPPTVTASLSAPAPRQAAPAVPAAPGGALATPADPCAGADALPQEPACRGAPLCAARDRVRTACELRDAMRARYVFLDAKPALLGSGFDARARLDGCVAAEREIAREDDPSRFFDRIRACLAGFEDGHLIVSSPRRLPQVALGVGLRRAGGHVVVGWREAGLRALVGDAVADAVPLGAEVLEIDGVPVESAVATLAREVSGSSAGARRARAVDALTRRDFLFPDRRAATLLLALAGGDRRAVELPWWVSADAEAHPVAGPWARRVGLPTTERLAWFEDAVRPRPAAPAEGAPPWAPVLPAAAAASLREYLDDHGRVAARLGAVEHGVAQPFCYLQLLSFHTERLAGPEGRRPYADVVTGFIHACGEQHRDVVLDLRRNEGGYLDHSTAIAEALAPRGAAEPDSALVLRATERNEAVYRERAASWDGDDGALAPRHVLDAIAAARHGGQELTAGFLAGPAHAGGFQGRVVALTSPACMSACDRLAALLKSSGRAVLVGSPTEGAGGSQQEAPGLPARWTDSARLLSVSIPNAAFGVRRTPAGLVVTTGASPAPAPGGQRIGALEVPAPVFFQSFGIENHPVEPDVRYESKIEDLTGAGHGWLQQIDAVLSGRPLALAAVAPSRAG